MRNRIPFSVVIINVIVVVIGSEDKSTSEGDSSVGNLTDISCNNLTIDSPYQDQVPVRECHFKTHTHPRQIPRKRMNETDIAAFRHLSLFSIKHDTDLLEAGEPCNVQLFQEWVVEEQPMSLNVFSEDRLWFKRLCNFFSYLECIPRGQMRPNMYRHGTHETQLQRKVKAQNKNAQEEEEKLPGSDLDKQEKKNVGNQPLPPLIFNDPGRNTENLVRLKIGGRGPGKGRHRSGPNAARIDATKLLGPQIPPEIPGYELDGICICSAYDPAYPDRKRPRYGIDFVEDEARENWCAAAPGNLCGRIYFPPKVWPGQDFEFSDHIGCPKKYQGEEYECVQWKQMRDKNLDDDEDQELNPNTGTSTCEKKLENPEVKAQRLLLEKKKRNSSGVVKSSGVIFIIISSSLICRLSAMI